MSELPGEIYRRIQAQVEQLDEYTPKWKYEARLKKVRQALTFYYDRGDRAECVNCGLQFPVFTVHECADVH